MSIEKDRINLIVPLSFKNILMAESKKMGVPMTSFIIFAVNEYIKQNNVSDMAVMFKELEKKRGVLEDD